jgi:hypothetical protein
MMPGLSCMESESYFRIEANTDNSVEAEVAAAALAV